MWATASHHGQVFERKDGKHHRGRDDAENEDTPPAKTVGEMREKKELKDSIHAPIQRQPHANGCRTQVESTILDWRRPHKWKVRFHYNVEEGEH